MPELLTAYEAAAILKVQPDTIRQWIRRKKLAGIKRGRDWFVTSTEINRMEKSILLT